MSATELLNSSVGNWLNVEATNEPDLFKHSFLEIHIGNPWIRSIHGGVTAGLSEICSQAAVMAADDTVQHCQIVNNSINYLKATRDDDCWVRVNVFRTTKRMAFVDVVCWQDSEDKPVTKATCTLRLYRRD